MQSAREAHVCCACCADEAPDLAQDDVSLQQQWAVNGKHYSRTLEDWLQRQDRQRKQVLAIMKVQPHDCQLDVLMLTLVCVKYVVRFSILAHAYFLMCPCGVCEDFSVHACGRTQ